MGPVILIGRGLLSDKGKPVERQGRKAMGLRAYADDCQVAEEQEFLYFYTSASAEVFLFSAVEGPLQ